jgi:hypothetical protein
MRNAPRNCFANIAIIARSKIIQQYWNMRLFNKLHCVAARKNVFLGAEFPPRLVHTIWFMYCL